MGRWGEGEMIFMNFLPRSLLPSALLLFIFNAQQLTTHKLLSLIIS
ncbi:MAG: hypothetical protein F6K36_27860 [Symploca sp. SIO3C6]|uniref:Uncharacterized protein n=1 Tax=Symploca sp. SIO1C4 TaxID=2607765 RepID=A0A6B3NF79_9CYAN|nr:hypothetical protein [Symploca sp. SIO3C6]NER27848.1 hypothetical protein [Symploca sp. SIO1C4]